MRLLFKKKKKTVYAADILDNTKMQISIHRVQTWITDERVN